jgi:cyanophycinase-like exopeptidase
MPCASLSRLLVQALLAVACLAGGGAAHAACATTEVEPNDTDSTATAGACSGVAISGSLKSASDYDWYRLDVTGAGTLSISLAHGAGVDFDWYLYAATGPYIAYASTTNNPETGAKAVGGAGTYYVRVKSYAGSGAYTLAVTGPIGGGGLPPPVLGPFTVPAKNVGDAPFTLTPPTSTGTGAWSYAISDASIASIAGATVTIKAAGSAVITATQAADATHAPGSATATLAVGGGTTAWPCTLPSGVNLGKVGSTTDKVAATSGGTVLMGGGTDVDAALQWMIGRSGGGDVVVIRSTGTNAYNSYIAGLGPVNSVQTLLIASAAQGDDACVAETIRHAEMLWIAGGNQQNYVDYWKGRKTGDAINYLISTKHAPVGGTSAGMAIMGQYYHPGGAAEDSTVLQDPTAIAIGTNFVVNPVMNNVVTEPHFTQRSRQPRLTSFLASSIYNDGVSWQAMRGIACDEATAYAVDTAGAGRVFGTGACFFVKPTGAAEVLAPGSALTWYVGNQALNVYRVPGTATGTQGFDMTSFTGTGGTTQTWTVTRGVLSIR